MCGKLRKEQKTWTISKFSVQNSTLRKLKIPNNIVHICGLSNCLNNLFSVIEADRSRGGCRVSKATALRWDWQPGGIPQPEQTENILRWMQHSHKSVFVPGRIQTAHESTCCTEAWLRTRGAVIWPSTCSLNWLITLNSVKAEIFKVFAILHSGAVFWNCVGLDRVTAKSDWSTSTLTLISCNQPPTPTFQFSVIIHEFFHTCPELKHNVEALVGKCSLFLCSRPQLQLHNLDTNLWITGTWNLRIREGLG